MNLSIGEQLANRIKVTPPVRLIVVSFLMARFPALPQAIVPLSIK